MRWWWRAPPSAPPKPQAPPEALSVEALAKARLTTQRNNARYHRDNQQTLVVLAKAELLKREATAVREAKVNQLVATARGDPAPVATGYSACICYQPNQLTNQWTPICVHCVDHGLKDFTFERLKGACGHGCRRNRQIVKKTMYDVLDELNAELATCEAALIVCEGLART